MPPRFLANLPLVLQMPKTREAWEKAASEGTKLLTFRTVPSANKVRMRCPCSLRNGFSFCACLQIPARLTHT